MPKRIHRIVNFYGETISPAIEIWIDRVKRIKRTRPIREIKRRKPDQMKGKPRKKEDHKKRPTAPPEPGKGKHLDVDT